VLCAYGIWKLLKKTKIVALKDIPLEDALRQAAQHPDEPEEKQKGSVRFISWIWD
jgi:yeast amino acid transporter